MMLFDPQFWAPAFFMPEPHRRCRRATEIRWWQVRSCGSIYSGIPATPNDIVALPAFGIVSDLISTHARKAIFGYRMMVWAILVIGALSFLVWAHHMYVSGMNLNFGFFFAVTTLIIAVPTAIKVYNWVLTLWRGDIHLTVPMLFALGFIITFSVERGPITGPVSRQRGRGCAAFGTQDAIVAHFHMVMGVAPILVVFVEGFISWHPKVTGRMLDERLGRIYFWITFLGAYATSFPHANYLRVYACRAAISSWARRPFIPKIGHYVEWSSSLSLAAVINVGCRPNWICLSST